ncbi:MAG: hypothetical protein KC468_27525 [Myxococcales bacterium]|nr:hypothetical protein [Myxococcales bacterium]
MFDKRLFLEEAILSDHHDAQRSRRADYVATLLMLLEFGVELSPGVRSRALAAAWARRDSALADHLLSRDAWGLAEVVRALQLLDSGRQARALERRVTRLEQDGRTRKRRLGPLRSQLADLRREGHAGSLSGALARRVRRWVSTIPADKLEYYAITFPFEPWRRLADLLHLAPSDFQLTWFLGHVFGEPAPRGTMTAACGEVDADRLADVARAHHVPYSYLRTRALPAPAALREAVASYESLDTLLWFYEELRCEATDQRIAARLEAGETPEFGYGKLIERLLALRDLKVSFWTQLLPVADRMLQGVRLPLDPPVVVLGDASSSMTSAIRVATIIGSLLTVFSRADLRFFNHELIEPPVVPRTIHDVLTVTDTVKATGSTAPAAALWPSLSRRELVRSFVVVTDEEENTQCQGQRFDAMYKRYREQVFPAQATFVSFIRQQSEGQMVRALRLQELPCRQFRLDNQRPDLTKLDSILGMMATDGPLFAERVETVAGWLGDASIAEVVPRLRALVGAAAADEASAAPNAAGRGLLGRLVSTLRSR